MSERTKKSAASNRRAYSTNAPDPILHREVVGIALVVDEGDGPRLVFRYPWAEGDGRGEGFPEQKRTTFHTLPPEFFAKFFKPKPVLCDQVLEMDIDGVNFTCTPTQISQDMGRRGVMFFNLIVASTAEVNPPPEVKPSFASPAADSKPPTTPTDPLSSSPPDGLNLSQADAGAGGVDGNDGGVSGKDGAGDRRRKPKRGPGVNLQLVCKAAEMLAKAICVEEIRLGYLGDNAKRLLEYHHQTSPPGTMGSGGLYDHRPRRGLGRGGGGGVVGQGYGRAGPKNTTEMSNAHRTFFNNMDHVEQNMPKNRNNPKQHPPAVVPRVFGGDLGSWQQESEQHQWERELLQLSRLARDLKEVFHVIAGGIAKAIKMNGTVSVSLKVAEGKEEIRPLRKYETILLLEEYSSLVAALPEDFSRTLKKLIQVASPLKTLEELASISEIPLTQVAAFTQNLVYWGHVRVIDTISMSNRYQVHRAALSSLIPPSLLAREFERTFKHPYNINRELLRFGSGRAISEVMADADQSQHATLLEVLLWLLRKDLLLQLGRYISLLIPDPQQGTGGSSGGAAGAGAAAGMSIGTSSAVSITRKRSGDSAFDGSSGGTYGSDGDNSAPRAWDGYGYENSFSSHGSSSALAQRAAETRVYGGGVDGGGDGGHMSGVVETPLKPFEEAYLRQHADGPEESKLIRKIAPFLRGKTRLREILWEVRVDDFGAVERVLRRFEKVLAESWFPIRNSTTPPNNSAGGV